MKTSFLDFEQPISELDAKINELRFVQEESAVDISEEICRLQKKSETLDDPFKEFHLVCLLQQITNFQHSL